jgi:hypothetical protein
MSDFSILNESSLHNTLKKLYAFQNDGQTEQELNNHIYDIFTKENEVIEIQNQNLNHILTKINDTLDKGFKIRVVHPVVVTKNIELYDNNKNLIKKTKSPVKGCIYSIFKEIKGIYQILLNPLFTLEVPFITITETRVQEDAEVQSKNKLRRYKKNWNKANKKLNEVLEVKTFKNKDDYLSLLPSVLPQEFYSKDLENALKEEKIPARIYKNSGLILWVFNKMGLIELTKTEKRRNYYKIKMI